MLLREKLFVKSKENLLNMGSLAYGAIDLLKMLLAIGLQRFPVMDSLLSPKLSENRHHHNGQAYIMYKREWV